jgi:proliferating cell nuclear antigen
MTDIPPSTKYEGMLFYLQTIKTSLFKQLIEALKDMLQDVNIICSPIDGLKIISLDVTETIVVRLKLQSRIGDFYCKHMCNLGVNMLLFNTIIKTLNNADVLTLYVNEADHDNLMIIIENKDKQRKSEYRMRLFDVKDEIEQIPKIEFPSVLTMPSTDFQRLCKDMSEFAKLLEINNVDNVLEFIGKGQLLEQRTTIYQITNPNEEGMQFLVNSDPNEIIHGFFCLKHLILFNKCTGLNKNVKIHLKNDCPLIISYDIGEFGDLCLCLAPKIPDENL